MNNRTEAKLTDLSGMQKAIDEILKQAWEKGYKFGYSVSNSNSVLADDRCKQIADHYGLDLQLNILQEECAELIQAVSKYKRNESANIIEELADVLIMIDQIVYLLNQKHDVNFYNFLVLWVEKKLRKQLERIESEGDQGEEE